VVLRVARQLAGVLRLDVAKLPPTRVAVDRLVLLHDRTTLAGSSKTSSRILLRQRDPLLTPLAWEAARVLRPGVHVTLLLRPALGTRSRSASRIGASTS